MPTIKIDNVDYDTDTLSNKAKAQLQAALLTPLEQAQMSETLQFK